MVQPVIKSWGGGYERVLMGSVGCGASHRVLEQLTDATVLVGFRAACCERLSLGWWVGHGSVKASSSGPRRILDWMFVELARR